MTLDFSRCRDVWVPDEQRWNPPPPHVKIGIQWIINLPYMLLADDMGGMKSSQAINAAQFLSEMGIIDRVIVVAPASVRPVWFDKELGQLGEHLWKGKRSLISEYHSKLKQWTHEPEGAKELRWICTNYEYIRREANLEDLLPYANDRTLLILDESSAVKGWDSAQTEACMKLRWKTNTRGRPVTGVPRAGRILMLNGTPVADSPMDMFSQGNLLHPSILGCQYVTNYRARYAIMQEVKGAGGNVLLTPKGKPVLNIAGWTNLEDLKRRFAPYVLRREAKELGIDFALPPIMLTVPLTERTWKIYRAMRDEMIAWLESGDVAVARQAAVKSIRLAQITSGFIGGLEEAWAEETEPTGPPQAPTEEVGREKLDFALEWQHELLQRYPDLKLLTWCRFVPELKRYLGAVQAANPGMPVGAVCGRPLLGGRNKEVERAEALRLLHPKTAPEGAVTVGGTYGTGAMGLNFTACRTVLDMSYDFSPWKKRQGDARVNRPGQTGPVSFFYLVAVGPKGQKTIDHHIIMNRLGKMEINDFTTAGWIKMLREE